VWGEGGSANSAINGKEVGVKISYVRAIGIEIESK